MTEQSKEEKHFGKEYKNIVVFSPRYTKMLVVMTAVVLGMGILIVGVSFFMLNRNKAKLSPEKLMVEQSRVQRVARLQGTMGILAVVAMFGIAHIKRKTRIYTNNEGIEYRTVFSKVFIPWDDVKDVRVKHTGTSAEHCIVKNRDLSKKIRFNAFMLDPNEGYRLTNDGIFNQHDEQVDYNLKKCTLYKEVMRMYNRKVRERGKKK